jgi:hypothetical protein
MRKRKVNYPVAKTATKRAPAPGSDGSMVRPNLANIDLTAGLGKAGLAVGDRVRIQASGLFSGEIAVIERFIGGPIPAALVRTEADRTRRVRTIDLEPVKASSPAQSSAPVHSTESPSAE